MDLGFLIWTFWNSRENQSSTLEQAGPDIHENNTPDDYIEPEAEYDFKELLDRQLISGVIHFLAKWYGYKRSA